jgi:hypothetical protein
LKITLKFDEVLVDIGFQGLRPRPSFNSCSSTVDGAMADGPKAASVGARQFRRRSA